MNNAMGSNTLGLSSSVLGQSYPNGTFVVWVINSHEGIRYVIGNDAVPTAAQLGDVVARLGPFGWERGQGLERYQSALNEGAQRHQQAEITRHENQRLQNFVQREVESRMAAGRDQVCETSASRSVASGARTWDQMDAAGQAAQAQPLVGCAEAAKWQGAWNPTPQELGR